MSAIFEPKPVTAPDMQVQMQDMQAILATGFASLRYCSYWLLRVECHEACMAWIDALVRADLVKNAAELGRDKDPVSGPHLHSEAVMIAFTFEGLHALGLREQADFPFPAPYRNGMADSYRSKALGDDNAPHWTWSDTGADAVHVLVAHYRDDPRSGVESLMCDAHSNGLSGCRVMARVDTCPSYTQQTQADGRNVYESTEPFGFRDGIAQPVIDGMRRSQAEQIARRKVGEQFEDRVVAPGEFILGHVNQYGELAYCPTVKGWPIEKNADDSDSRFALNGSYLAVRQILQHTDRFRDMLNEHRPKSGEPSLAERMVGRKMNGEPLVQCPFVSADQDAFRYRVADFDGFQCPRGAHVRRANPRDMLAWNVESGIAASKLHRLLRRGRVYAAATRSCERPGEPECGHKSHVYGARGAPQCAEGLFFMALNADIDRQFEFVQQRWINNRQFADLSGEDDFTSGMPAPHAFTTQGMPTGDRTEHLAQFTDTIGGGYFFVPGLSALRFLASGCRPPV